MRRREVIALIGIASAWPFAARAQQSAIPVKPPTIPVIGYLGSSEPTATVAAQFRRGLSEIGYVDGGNIAIESRFAHGQYGRLPTLAADLVSRQVAVLVASSGVQTALAAKEATRTIPIVFGLGSDPVKFGLVASLNQPGGNVTGVTFLTTELKSKRLGLLHELVPRATAIAVLVNPTNSNSEGQSKELKEAARRLGLQLHFAHVDSESELDLAFATIAEVGAGAVLIASDPFYFSRREQLIALAARYSTPAIYDFRAYAEAGGLASYGTDLGDAYRQVGIYVGQILNGQSPAELPVVQSSKFELVINLKTARAMGLTIRPTLLARADEVIE